MYAFEEYLATFADKKINPNIFYDNDKALFKDLLTISNTKHYEHLSFLSNKHSGDIMKLRFVHKPSSFVFLLQGDKYYHIIWETLDTEEATYIWQAQKSIRELRQAFKKVENDINIIKAQGKTAYINSADDSFRRVFHDYTDSLNGGFSKWKREMEDILT